MAPQHPQVEALLFDVFGTVVDWRGSLVRWFERFGEKRGLRADWAALVDDWRAAYQPAMEPIRRGERPYVTLDVLHRESLDRLLPQHGLAALDEADRRRDVHAWHELDPWPDTVPGLLRLKKKFVVASLSNGGVALQVNMARHAGLPWDMIFSADLFRMYKPQPATYLGAAAWLDRPPERLMLVAAHNSDLFAARGCGLRTAFVARPTEYGPRQSKDFKPEADWDLSLASLEELAAQLSA